MEDKMQFAVLIDADNISFKYVSTIFSELDKYGFASYRRIYGNWTKGNGWKENILLEYSIIPVQQFSYTSGKNATDMAMVIDAMDILYKGNVDGFCLVTSDSDFTRLAMRLREENMYVLGMGESKTPLALTKACNRFVHLNLIEEQNKDTLEEEKILAGSSEKRISENVTEIRDLETAILSMLNEAEDKMLDLGTVGRRLDEKFTDFDVRNYGYTKLNVFLAESMPSISLFKKDGHTYVQKREVLDRKKLENEIIGMIVANGGCINNLSIINEDLKKRYDSFDLKDYGYSRLSSFLRSIKKLSVSGNKVRIRGYSPDGELR